MGGLLHMAGDLVAQRLAHHPISGHYKTGLAFMVISGFMLCLGTGFLLYAAYLWALVNYSPHTAAATVGILSILISFLFAIAVQTHKYLQQKKVREIRKETTEILQDIITFAEEELTEPVRDNIAAAIVVASFAGYFTGKKCL